MKSIKAFAPATVANVSCGFDIFGFAVEAPADEVIVTLTEKPEVVIKKITGDEGRLPLGSLRETLPGWLWKRFLRQIGSNQEPKLYCIRSSRWEVAWVQVPRVRWLHL